MSPNKRFWENDIQNHSLPKLSEVPLFKEYGYKTACSMQQTSENPQYVFCAEKNLALGGSMVYNTKISEKFGFVHVIVLTGEDKRGN